MPAVMPLLAGDPAEVGGYRLEGRLGVGGQGVVYLGRTAAGTPVAVKLLHENWSDDEDGRRRFAREIAAARRVAPFCVAQVLDADLDGPRPYVVSEYVEGPSLQQAGRRSGPALHRLAVATATALAAVHQAGIVHRDFKPANVLLGPDGPRVIDFGIARHLGATTASGGIVGTPAYMAPEQIAGEPPTPAGDVFAWGGVMVFAATGRPPFGDDALPAVLNRVLNREPDLGDLEEPLRSIVARALRKDPAERPDILDITMRLLGGAPPGEAGRGPGTLAAAARFAGAAEQHEQPEQPQVPRPPVTHPSPMSPASPAPPGALSPHTPGHPHAPAPPTPPGALSPHTPGHPHAPVPHPPPGGRFPHVPGGLHSAGTAPPSGPSTAPPTVPPYADGPDTVAGGARRRRGVLVGTAAASLAVATATGVLLSRDVGAGDARRTAATVAAVTTPAVVTAATASPTASAPPSPSPTARLPLRFTARFAGVWRGRVDYDPGAYDRLVVTVRKGEATITEQFLEYRCTGTSKLREITETSARLKRVTMRGNCVRNGEIYLTLNADGTLGFDYSGHGENEYTKDEPFFMTATLKRDKLPAK